jgi:hypothetical protein
MRVAGAESRGGPLRFAATAHQGPQVLERAVPLTTALALPAAAHSVGDRATVNHHRPAGTAVRAGHGPRVPDVVAPPARIRRAPLDVAFCVVVTRPASSADSPSLPLPTRRWPVVRRLRIPFGATDATHLAWLVAIDGVLLLADDRSTGRDRTRLGARQRREPPLSRRAPRRTRHLLATHDRPRFLRSRSTTPCPLPLLEAHYQPPVLPSAGRGGRPSYPQMT